jgi:ABC-2 type transport system permease protein
MLFLAFAPILGIHLTPAILGSLFVVQTLVAFGLTNLGLIIAWRMESTQGFHAIMNLILLPIWLLSGAFFPAIGATAVLRWAMVLNPLTYGMAALRRCLYLGHTSELGSIPPLGLSLVVVVLFAAVTFWVATRTAERATL